MHEGPTENRQQKLTQVPSSPGFWVAIREPIWEQASPRMYRYFRLSIPSDPPNRETTSLSPEGNIN